MPKFGASAALQAMAVVGMDVEETSTTEYASLSGNFVTDSASFRGQVFGGNQENAYFFNGQSRNTQTTSNGNLGIASAMELGTNDGNSMWKGSALLGRRRKREAEEQVAGGPNGMEISNQTCSVGEDEMERASKRAAHGMLH